MSPPSPHFAPKQKAAKSKKKKEQNTKNAQKKKKTGAKNSRKKSTHTLYLPINTTRELTGK